jgi:hypothetical protein
MADSLPPIVKGSDKGYKLISTNQVKGQDHRGNKTILFCKGLYNTDMNIQFWQECVMYVLYDQNRPCYVVFPQTCRMLHDARDPRWCNDRFNPWYV